MGTLSSKKALIGSALVVLAVIGIVLAVVKTQDKTSDVRIEQVVYDEEEGTEEDDGSVGFQIVVLSPEDGGGDMDKALEDVNRELSEENKGAHLKPIGFNGTLGSGGSGDKKTAQDIVGKVKKKMSEKKK